MLRTKQTFVLVGGAMRSGTTVMHMRDEVSGAFWSDLYTKALTTEQIGRHRTVLPPEEISEIQTYLASFGDRFGYW